MSTGQVGLARPLDSVSDISRALIIFLNMFYKVLVLGLNASRPK